MALVLYCRTSISPKLTSSSGWGGLKRAVSEKKNMYIYLSIPFLIPTLADDSLPAQLIWLKEGGIFNFQSAQVSLIFS